MFYSFVVTRVTSISLQIAGVRTENSHCVSSGGYYQIKHTLRCFCHVAKAEDFNFL